MKEVIIQANDAGQRLDKFLFKSFPHLTKGAMYKAVRNKKIKVNRKRAQFDQKLMEGDHILLFLAPDLLEKEEKKLQPFREVDVVYEDEDLIVLNKPAGLLSMKDSAGDQDTLNDRLLSYMAHTGAYDPKAEQSFTPSIAHRLDRNTSGLVLAGKNAKSARALAKDIREHAIEKSYLAITDKRPRQGRIVLYMKKDDTKALVSDTPKEGYSEAIMRVNTIADKNGRYLSQVDLETGRFHQIRACLSHMGTPLCGDVKYGGTPQKNRKGYALQAYTIGLENSSFEKPKRISLSEEKRLALD